MGRQELQETTLQIKPVAPYRLDLTVWALKRRPDNDWDRWDGRTYARVLVVHGHPVEVCVHQQGSLDRPILEVRVEGRDVTPETAVLACDTAAMMLGVYVDLSGFARMAQCDHVLAPLVTRLRGAKPTRYPSIYEGLVNAICCQQLTLTFGLRLVSRLVAECGPRLGDGIEVSRAFPGPRDVLTVSPARLKEMGFSRQKARALLELSARLHDGSLSLDGLEDLDDTTVKERLVSLRGVGRWTAEYVMLRTLGRLYLFPGDDVGGRNNVQRWLGLDAPLDYLGVQQVLAAWRDYAGLLYFYLLLLRLDEAGYLDDMLSA